MKFIQSIQSLFLILVLGVTAFLPAQNASAFSVYSAMVEATHTEALAMATRTASVNGSAVDLIDHTGYVAITLMSEAATAGTSPTLDVKVQDSADGSTGWGDVSGATFTQVTDAADAHETITVNSDTVKRYIRIVGTIGGTSTPTFPFGVTMAGFDDNR